MEIKFEQIIQDHQVDFAATLVNLTITESDLNTVKSCVKWSLPEGFTCGRGASHIWIHEADENGNPKQERWAIITE